MVQREQESLREFVQRFSKAVLEVLHVNPELLASIVQQNLRRNRFKDSIVGKPPTTFDELLVMAKNTSELKKLQGHALQPQQRGKLWKKTRPHT